jgi:hypothetical protein
MYEITGFVQVSPEWQSHSVRADNTSCISKEQKLNGFFIKCITLLLKKTAIKPVNLAFKQGIYYLLGEFKHDPLQKRLVIKVRGRLAAGSFIV